MNDQHDQRDPLLVDLLTELPVPDHAAGFWDALDRRLAVESNSTSTSTNGSHPGPDDSSAPKLVALDDVSVAGAPRLGRHRWLSAAGAGLIAAVALVAALFGLRAAFGGGGESGVIVTDPIGEPVDADGAGSSRVDGTPSGGDAGDGSETGPERGSSARPLVDYARPSPQRELGPGSVIGYSPDGSRVLVLHDHPSGERGEEAAGGLTVWSYPVAGGDARLALPDTLHIETGTSSADFAIGSGGDIAWIERCDGRACGLRSAVLSPEGAITDVVELDLSPIRADADGGVATVSDLALGADGSLHLAANGNLMLAERGSASIDTAVDRSAELIAVVDGRDGEELLTWADGVLADRSGPIAEPIALDVHDLVGSPGGVVAAIGSEQVARVRLDDGSVEFVGPVPADWSPIDVAFSPDGHVVGLLGGGELLFEGVDGGDLAGPFPIGPARDGVFAPDGTSYAVTVVADEGRPATHIIDFPSETEADADRVIGADVAEDAEATTATTFELESTEISSFTVLIGCCDERAVNVGLVAEATDGIVIPAGGTFSLNGAVGERTTERGYVGIATIVDGVLTNRVGDGVNDYATALFNAALVAGLSIEEYQSHDLYVSRFPYGRDVTIGWPRPDLVIRNETGADVTIVNTVGDGTGATVTVQMFGAGGVEVDIGEPVETQLDRCTRVETPRTVTFPDGSVTRDSIVAVYRSGEGLSCDGLGVD